MKREKMIGALTVFCAIVLALSLFLVIEKSQNLTITRDVSIEEIGIGEYMVNVIRAHKDAERASADVSGRGLLEHRFFYYFYEEDNRIYLYTVDEDSRVNGIFHLERQYDVIVDIVSVEKDFALAKEELFEEESLLLTEGMMKKEVISYFGKGTLAAEHKEDGCTYQYYMSDEHSVVMICFEKGRATACYRLKLSGIFVKSDRYPVWKWNRLYEKTEI